MKKIVKKGIALLLSCGMVLSVFASVPFSAMAASEYTERTDDYYKLISQSDWEIAPGITESEIVLNNEDGTHRQVAHVLEVDINNPYTKVMPSYKGMAEGLEAKDYGIQNMSEQAAYAEANGYGNVVGAMNLSLRWYGGDYYKKNPELVGEPLAYIVMDGVQYTNSQGQSEEADTCLVINYDEKDGVTRPSNIPKTQMRKTEDPLTGWEEQVIPANFGFIVKDGKNQSKKTHDVSGASPRSCVGIKEDGTIVVVMNDGRQQPYSTGFNRYELGEFMLSLGCEHAILGDSGGSSTFLSQRPGEDLEMHSSPSDGGERATTHGVLVISTAPATGEFVRAHVSAEDDYYTPRSAVQFTAVGSDSVGTAADIPESAYWQLSNPSMGTIEDGLFLSSGKVGKVTAQLVYNGEVVGEDTINIVVPEKLTFTQDTITVPYDGKIPLKLVATYGYNEVKLSKDDYTFKFSDAKMGTIKDDVFYATSDTAHPGGTINATLTCDPSLNASMTIKLGKPSVVVYDFEEGAESIANIEYVYQESGDKVYSPELTHAYDSIEVASVEDGAKVKSGNHALKITAINNSVTSMNWNGTYFTGWDIDLTDAVSLSFWLYVPEGSHGYIIETGNARALNPGYCKKYGTGWHYLTVDVEKMNGITNLNTIVFGKADIDCTETDYIHSEHPNYYTDVVFYLDDITVNYSTAVEDHNPPAISDVVLQLPETDDTVTPEGQVIYENKVSLKARATDTTTESVYVGLDTSSVEVFVDGNKITSTCDKNGNISTEEVVLADGMHTFRIELADNNGNETYAEKQINIMAGGDAETILYAPKDASLDRLLLGSVYWMDLTATDIENVDTVETIIDLDNNSKWCLDHMELAEGFSAEYTIDKENSDATITITRTGDVTASGETVIASLPIRVWYPQHGNQTDRHRNVAVETFIEKGLLTKTDGKTVFFGSEKICTMTESYGTRQTVGRFNDWHRHTAKKMFDQAATCTKTGYKDRTYCTVCSSVVDWGTTVPATGHALETDSEGRLVCKNEGQLFSGVHTDGKTYVDGIVITDGWNADHTSYYVDGVKVTGQVVIDGTLCTFDEKGIYQKDVLYTDFYYDEDAEKWMYFNNNEAMTGFVYINKAWYYFMPNNYAATGTKTINGHKYEFEGDQGKVIGAWAHTSKGSRFYFCATYYTNTWATIKGEKYYFNNEGYCYKGTVAVSHDGEYLGAWEFDENGKFIGNITGAFKDAETGYYHAAKDGVLLNSGLVKLNNNIYYARANYRLATEDWYVDEGAANGLVPKAGKYKFAADGKMDTSGIEGSVERIWGKSRYMTSLSIADELKAELGVSKFETVIIASGKNFPDALAGSYLAAKKSAPILMVDDSTTNITLVQNYIKKNLKSDGKIYILGGSAAVPESIEKNLNAMGYDVERLKGKSRYETNIAILEEAGVANEAILVCTGSNFADSLSASAAGLPILLVDPKAEKLNDAQKEFLADKDNDIYIIGGEGAVSDVYKVALKKYDEDGTVDRVKGKSRYETSVEVAKNFCDNPTEAVIAYAVNFPDGLCGGPLAYLKKAPLILTADKKESAATAYVEENLIFRGSALGGSGVLPDNTVKEVFGMSKSNKITGQRYE